MKVLKLGAEGLKSYPKCSKMEKSYIIRSVARKGQNTPKSDFRACLILVISFTLAGFLNPNNLHPKITRNTQKLQQIATKSVKY